MELIGIRGKEKLIIRLPKTSSGRSLLSEAFGPRVVPARSGRKGPIRGGLDPGRTWTVPKSKPANPAP